MGTRHHASHPDCLGRQCAIHTDGGRHSIQRLDGPPAYRPGREGRLLLVGTLLVINSPRVALAEGITDDARPGVDSGQHDNASDKIALATPIPSAYKNTGIGMSASAWHAAQEQKPDLAANARCT